MTALAAPTALRRGDPGYDRLVSRGYNLRFTGTPDLVWAPRSAREVEHTLRDALDRGARVAARSGGHCMEDLVDDPAVRALVDLSALRSVRFDEVTGTLAVGAGGRLGEVYRQLYLRWGVALPGGENPEVGVGGHVPGGGHGVLCRRDGLVSDHLHGVEVVVVDPDSGPRTVIATAESDQDLWWAHTGAGGGNFGVVTRYLFRSPGARATDPARMLPAAPEAVLRFRVEWPWSGMDDHHFAALVRAHGDWSAAHAEPDSPYAAMYSELYLNRRELGSHHLVGQITAGPDARALITAMVAAMSGGVPHAAIAFEECGWVDAALRGVSGERARRWRTKIKGGYLRAGFTDAQIAALHHHLTRPADVGAGMVTLMSYGGAVNTVEPSATATAQRRAVLKLSYLAAWDDPALDDAHVDWLRELYRDVYAASGGVPDPEDGSYINYPDRDLADPAWNTSGVGWDRLYFGENLERLRAVKARWDPLGVFTHALTPSEPG